MGGEQTLVRFGADVTDFIKGLDEASEAFKGMSRGLQKVGRELTKSVTVPIAGIATAALVASEDSRKAFLDFGSGVKDIFADLGTDIFQALNIEGLLRGLEESLRGVVEQFTDLGDSTKVVITGGAAVAAAVGPMIERLGALGGTMSGVIDTTRVLVQNWSKIGPVLLNPISLLSTAVVGLIAGVIALNIYMARNKTFVKDAATTIEEMEERVKAAKKALDNFQETDFDALSQEAARVRDRIEEDEAAIAKLNTQLQMSHKELMDWGLSISQINGRIKIHEERLGRMRQELEKLTKARDANRRAMLEEEYASELANLASQREAKAIQRSQALFSANGDERAKLRRQIEIYKAKIEELLPVYEQEEGTIKSYTRAIDDAELALARLGQAPGPEDQLTVWENFNNLIRETPSLAKQVADALFATVQSFSQGVGQAVAQTLIFGASLGKGLINVLKQVAASLIASLISLGVQKLILSSIFKITTLSENVQAMAGYAQQTYASTYASISAIPIVGPGLAPAAATGAVAAMLAGSLGAAAAGAAAGGLASGVSAAATGGIFSRPNITTIAERGPEIVLNKRNVDDFFGGGGTVGANVYHFSFNLDGRQVAAAIVPEMPGVLRYHGINL
jgi:hypothetical protein